MFKDFYENVWKKTTPQEKKDVVKSTGKYFPENHSNKIKGIDDLAEAVVNNAIKKQNDIVSGKRKTTKDSYTTKNCEKCGDEFQCYRNVGRYCEECKKTAVREAQRKYNAKRAEKEKTTPRVIANAKKRAKSRGTTYEYELTKIVKGLDPLRAPNRHKKSGNRDNGYAIYTKVGKATLRERECASKRASNRGTEYLYELERILNGTEPIRSKVGNPNFSKHVVSAETVEVTTPEQREKLEEFEQKTAVDTEVNDAMVYLELMQKAISIVSAVKSTENIKECIDKVYDILNK